MSDIIAQLRDEIEKEGNWTEVARRAGIRRESLHRIFGTGRTGLMRRQYRRSKPNFTTLEAVAEALGFRIVIERCDP